MGLTHMVVQYLNWLSCCFSLLFSLYLLLEPNTTTFFVSFFVFFCMWSFKPTVKRKMKNLKNNSNSNAVVVIVIYWKNNSKIRILMNRVFLSMHSKPHSIHPKPFLLNVCLFRQWILGDIIIRRGGNRSASRVSRVLDRTLSP